MNQKIWAGRIMVFTVLCLYCCGCVDKSGDMEPGSVEAGAENEVEDAGEK